MPSKDSEESLTTGAATTTLNRATRKKAEALGHAIDDTEREAKALAPASRQELEAVADRYSRAPSAFLAGVVGGVVGSGGGIAVWVAGGTALALSGPLGLAVGVAVGVLWFRGASWLRLERATHRR